MLDTLSRKQIDSALADAAREVLETMFFTSVAGPAEPPAGEPRLAVRLWFRGAATGLFGLSLPAVAAPLIAADFLGAETTADLPDQGAEAVLREMGNVICGAALSRIASDGAFELGPPEMVPERVEAHSPEAGRCSLETDRGVLTVCLAMGPAS